ncbi:hypothetical protein HDU97_004300 [Phlyctochytrium planicorne]|nr:hypothetical protein HDU97_004300 [Phlyctochytrium planicorne]
MPTAQPQFGQPLMPGVVPWGNTMQGSPGMPPNPQFGGAPFSPLQVWGQPQGTPAVPAVDETGPVRAGSLSSLSSDGSLDGYVYTEDHLKAAPCPRCEGRGWKHETSSKHDKIPTVKCKNCASCKACHSSGQVHGKIACPTCETKGFVHGSNERSHDAPEKLRCFFCKNCPQCAGIGIVDNPAVAEQERLRAKMKAKMEARAAKKKAKELAEAMAAATSANRAGAGEGGADAQQQQLLMMSLGMMLQHQKNAMATGVQLPQPSLQMLMTAAAASSGVVPPIPMPPVLPVMMVPLPQQDPSVQALHQKMLHVAAIPGVGYVPAGQVMGMQIPMLPGGVAPMPSHYAAAMATQQQQPAGGGMVLGPQREAALRDVWG